MQVPDKVTITDLSGGHPFHHLKNINVKAEDGQTPIKSRIEVTISGRTVYRPIKKK